MEALLTADSIISLGNIFISDRKNRSVLKASLAEKKRGRSDRSPAEIKYLRRKRETLEGDD